MTNEPKPFEVRESGALLHGTKAVPAVGDLLVQAMRDGLADLERRGLSVIDD